MVENVAAVVRELEQGDFNLLSGVEQGMRFSEWVDRRKLPEYSGLTTENVEYRLDRCTERDLVERRTIQYEGYQLTFEGYDVLALHTFAERDTIESVGAPLGVGKESDVYEAKSYKPLALKFHREGYTDFREVHKERDWAADKQHVSWLYTARKAAEREHEVLRELFPTVSVPRPIDQNRHAIVMEQFDGVELGNARLEADQVLGVLDLVLSELATAYSLGYVHADMSEHNIAVGESGVTVFDWPQAVGTDHGNATELLERDLTNLLGYFDRKYPNQVPDIDPGPVVEEIIEGEFESLQSLLDPDADAPA